MSDSESYSAPNALWVLVNVATRPSRPSRTMATSMATAACSKRQFIAWTMAKNPANSAPVVSRLGNRKMPRRDGLAADVFNLACRLPCLGLSPDSIIFKDLPIQSSWRRPCHPLRDGSADGAGGIDASAKSLTRNSAKRGSQHGSRCSPSTAGQVQLRLRSTSLLALIQGIMSRNFSPTISIGCSAFKRRRAVISG
jgi:hypothetical protein